MSIERWGQSQRVNPRRRFYKVLGKLPAPFDLVLEEYTDIYNAVRVEFDCVDDGVFPARILARCRTGYAYDVLSRDQYGSRSQTLQVGAMTTTDAVCLRNLYLADHANPSFTIDRR